MKTWMIESLVVAAILVAVNIFTHRIFTIEILASIAVLLSFGYASIGDRLLEQEAARTIPQVECYRKMNYYFMGKEFFWFLYFFLNHSYSALVGVIVFLAYPVWRSVYRKHIKPYGQNSFN
jgi:hypothetical protein